MQWIADIFIKVLESLNTLTGSFGLSLVFFAVIIKIALWPLTNMQYKGMKKMQALQPEIDRLKKQHGKDQMAFAQAQQNLMNERGVNPLSSCLPTLAQMPILISIWHAIIGKPALFANSYFLWIRPGPLQASYPEFFASSLADRDSLLILIYGATMLIQQQLNPSSGASAKQQKIMGLAMSVLFTLMMWWYAWPCAMIIYWVVFNFLTIIQQGIIQRSSAEEDVQAPTAQATTPVTT